MKEIKEDCLIQYYIVNNDLIKKYDMSAGKIAAQVSHAARLIALRDQNTEKFKQWTDSSITIMRVVVLKGSEKELRKLLDNESLAAISIIDKGFTEIPPDSLTVVVLPVMWKSEAQQYVKRLQLL